MVLPWITSDPKTENIDQSLNFLQKNAFHKKIISVLSCQLEAKFQDNKFYQNYLKANVLSKYCFIFNTSRPVDFRKSYEKKKTRKIFIFTLLCGASVNRFHVGLKCLHKIFWGTTKKIKLLFNFLSLSLGLEKEGFSQVFI